MNFIFSRICFECGERELKKREKTTTPVLINHRNYYSGSIRKVHTTEREEEERKISTIPTRRKKKYNFHAHTHTHTLLAGTIR